MSSESSDCNTSSSAEPAPTISAVTQPSEFIQSNKKDSDIFAKVDRYINNLFAREDAALAGVEQSLIDIGSSLYFASVSPNQGKLLQLFCKMAQAKRVLELGTLGGYSAIWLARALPADGKVISIENDPKVAAVAEKNIAAAGLSDKIEIRLGKCMDVLQDLQKEQGNPFDVVFIDADKPPYAEYFELCLKLSRPGTIILADNVIRDGKVLDPNSTDAAVKGVQRFNEALSRNHAVDATILQTVGLKLYDGLAVAVVR